MGKNYAFWMQEHKRPDMLPQISIKRPSASVVKFIKFLKEHEMPIEGANVLTLGCGKGRNELYMAKHGLKVVGVDYVDAAVKKAEKRAKAKFGDNWRDKIEFVSWDAFEYLRTIESESYDYVADITFTTDLEDDEERRVVGEQAYRILKEGGLLLFYGLHVSDPISEFQLSGREEVVYLKEYDKYEKLFDEDSAKRLYSKLEMLTSEVIEKERTYLGERIKTRLLYAVFKK